MMEEQITTVLVGKIPQGVTDARLLDIFQTFGTVVSCSNTKLCCSTAQALGRSVVRYSSRAEAEMCVQAASHGQVEAHGQILQVTWSSRSRSNPLTWLGNRGGV